MKANEIKKFFPARNPDVILREEDEDGGLIFNPDNNQIRVLNPSAILIWKNCDGQKGVEEIIQIIKDTYENVPDRKVEDDVGVFLEDMRTNGFIDIKES